MPILNPEDLDLVDALGTYATDPYAFALWAFPWSEPGELERFDGPNSWQTRLLKNVRDGLPLEEAIQIAVSSGHGVGKSALVAMLVWWAFSTREKTRGVVTANTENQLKTKTWVELAKWHRLFIAKHLFKCTATALFSIDEELAREWRIDIVPWSERNTEAFAGLHNQGNRIIIVFDEASAIPDVIWEVTEGALTDRNTDILWLVFGNPTKATGRFRECFPDGKFAHRWQTFKVDSRKVAFTDHAQIARWIEDYGIDSDFVKVRVLGEFPSVSFNAFISRELVASAVLRPIEPQEGALVLGVDVGRYGGDFSVAWPRRGQDASSIPPRAWLNLSTTALAVQVANFFHSHDMDAIFVDGGGIGGGVVDTLIDFGLPVYDIQFQSRPDGLHDGVRYMNKRAEMWGLLRQALPRLSIPSAIPGYARDILTELSSVEYKPNEGTGSIQLEAKDLMIRRLGYSPDAADALALTFAFPVESKIAYPSAPSAPYNPYSPERLNAQAAQT